MIKTIKLIIFTSLFLVATSFAADKAATKSTKAVKATASAPLVMLYAEPKTASKVVAKLKPNTPLAPIYQEKDWYKVAVSSRDGQVGWINRQQYRTAMQAFYQPLVQTVYVQTTRDEKNGKPQINVVAYRNGKKVSDQEAKALYQKITQQQQAQWQQMRVFDVNMNRFWQDENRLFQDMSRPDFMLAPGPVLPQQK